MTVHAAVQPRSQDPAGRRFGTFSSLPPLTREQATRQIEHILSQGWTCALEHVEPSRATTTYWYLWKLPLFGVTTAADVLAELRACHEANPGHLIRLVGYDRRRQTQGLAFPVDPQGPGWS